MSSLLRRIGRGARTQQGAAAIVLALSMVGLLIVGGIVLDFGVVRMDRQANKSAADSAVMAGLRAADRGDDQVYNALGVCGTLSFLKANRPALNGLGSALETGGSCATPSTTQVCTPTAADPNPTQVTFHDITTYGNNRYEVWIKSPYQVTDTTTGGPKFPEELLTSVTAGKPLSYGCDQIGLVIKEWTKPGFGRLVTSSDLVTRIRSVGRVAIGPGDMAPALLLLDQTHCSVLDVGAHGVGADSHIRVKGRTSSVIQPDGTTKTVSTPGSIHSDSKASPGDCSGTTSSPVLQGAINDGIVAYGSPDGVAKGVISSVATANGVSDSTVSDGIDNVYGTISPDAPGKLSPSKPVGRLKVSRSPVDNRYLGGVQSAVTTADSVLGYDPTTLPSPWVRVSGSDCTSPTAAQKAANMVWVDCTKSQAATASTTYQATTIVFNGEVDADGLSLPNAKFVYVKGGGGGNKGIVVTNLSINTNASNLDASGRCGDPADPSSANDKSAVLVVRDGTISASASTASLRMCHTAVIMEGGYSGACLPASVGARTDKNPYDKPCNLLASPGNGFVQFNGGSVDWTSPNKYSGAIPLADRVAAWTNLEDLALWGESYGVGTDWSMSGGSLLNLVGVLMTPNAWPFVVSGSGSQQLTNAQFVASRFALKGGATLTMSVDPNNNVTLQILTPFSLVR